MTIYVLWNSIEVLKIIKREGMYYSTVNIDNVEDAKSNGLPMYLLNNVQAVSKELPVIIKDRISSVKGKIKFRNDVENEEVEDKILDYINSTECKRPTDRLGIKIEIN